MSSFHCSAVGQPRSDVEFSAGNCAYRSLRLMRSAYVYLCSRTKACMRVWWQNGAYWPQVKNSAQPRGVFSCTQMHRHSHKSAQVNWLCGTAHGTAISNVVHRKNSKHCISSTMQHKRQHQPAAAADSFEIRACSWMPRHIAAAADAVVVCNVVDDDQCDMRAHTNGHDARVKCKRARSAEHPNLKHKHLFTYSLQSIRP